MIYTESSTFSIQYMQSSCNNLNILNITNIPISILNCNILSECLSNLIFYSMWLNVYNILIKYINEFEIKKK